MLRRSLPDPTLARARAALLATQASRNAIIEHIEESIRALDRSAQRLRATVPVLPYRNDVSAPASDE
jgi:hypothetical protein